MKTDEQLFQVLQQTRSCGVIPEASFIPNFELCPTKKSDKVP